MKKTILNLTAMFVLVFSIFLIDHVNADTITAKAPDALPSEDATLSAVLDEPFDFSKITFKSDNGSTITGHNYMRKIILTQTPNPNGATTLEKLGDNWFTVYCLDGNLKFPMYSFTNFDFGVSEDDVKLQQIVMFALANNSNLRNVFLKAKGYSFDPNLTLELNGKTSTELLAEINADTEVEILVKEVKYTNAEMQQVVVTAGDLSGNADDETYTVKVKKSDLAFDKYYAKKLDSTNYNHALWIIEHSYPTLGINESLMMAGASYDTLLSEIKLLYPDETYTDDKWAALVEDYVYSTVQYAIWKANGGIDVAGNKLGDELNGSAELNKLYQYLIKNRDEYNGYDTLTFNNTLTVKNPSGNEIFQNTKEYYVYGPYTVDYDLISIDKVLLSLDGTTNGVTLVNRAGNEISEINPGENFYIKVMKKNKVANVKVKLSTQNALTFKPSTNRGRIYTSYYPLVQNAISGGKITTTDIEKTVDVVFNPKTGSNNIAVLFAITLVAFSLGYLALSIKSKPVEL